MVEQIEQGKSLLFIHGILKRNCLTCHLACQNVLSDMKEAHKGRLNASIPRKSAEANFTLKLALTWHYSLVIFFYLDRI